MPSAPTQVAAQLDRLERASGGCPLRRQRQLGSSHSTIICSSSQCRQWPGGGSPNRLLLCTTALSPDRSCCCCCGCCRWHGNLRPQRCRHQDVQLLSAVHSFSNLIWSRTTQKGGGCAVCECSRERRRGDACAGHHDCLPSVQQPAGAAASSPPGSVGTKRAPAVSSVASRSTASLGATAPAPAAACSAKRAW